MTTVVVETTDDSILQSVAATLPPVPVLWLTALLDTVLMGLDWRSLLGLSDEGWAMKVPKMAPCFEPPLTFQDYYYQQQSSVVVQDSSLSAQQRSSSLLQLLYDYALRTPGTALQDLTTPTALFVLVILLFLLRFVKHYILLPQFAKTAHQVALQTHGTDWIAQNPERLYKFGEYCFRLTCHTAISIMGIYCFYDAPWWEFDGLSYKGGRAVFQIYDPLPPGLVWYYLFQAAYNVDAFLSLIELSFVAKWQWPINSKKRNINSFQLPLVIQWSDTARGDFREMMFHHVVTNGLVFGSSPCHITRTGSMVLLIHDLSDIWVDLSKLAHFVQWKQTTVVCFVGMCINWLALRLIFLPAVILRSTIVDTTIMCNLSTHPERDPVITERSCTLLLIYRQFFWYGLGALVALHASWFGMMLRMGWTLVSKGEHHDYSEHKAGEEQQQQQESPAIVATTASDDDEETIDDDENDHISSPDEKKKQ